VEFLSKFFSATVALVVIVIRSADILLKITFSVRCTAIGTNQVKWLTVPHFFFDTVCQATRANFSKRVASLVIFPVLEPSYFLLEILVPIDQFRLGLLSSQYFLLQIDHSLILRRAASSISFNPRARSNAVFKALIPANTSATIG
jgi:hypothetical protein